MSNDQKRKASSPAANPNENKKLALEQIIGTNPEQVEEVIAHLASGSNNPITLDPAQASLLTNALRGLMTFTEEVLSGKSGFIHDGIREERRLRTAVFAMKAPLVQTVGSAAGVETEVDKAVRSVNTDVAEANEVRAMVRFLGVSESPASIYRINPHLVKVELHSRASLATVLKNRRSLSNTKWSSVFIRESQTKEERDRLRALRRQRAFLEETDPGKWALYRNSLRWRSDINTDRTHCAPVPPTDWAPKHPAGGPPKN